ncbi:MAG: hypothetical protein QGH45_23285 [Myxococcota bacterium]|nr:hypothetical protein [Myxococcota bacterium]
MDTPWSLDIYCHFEGNMRGAWDWNNNGLFEPGDDWGVTVNGLGEDNNPWPFADVDIPDMEVEVPYDDTVIPLPAGYVKISGVVTTDGSFEFADLDAANGLFIGANKNFDVPPLDPQDLLQQGYVWGFDQIPSVAGMSDAIAYSLWVPPYTTSFLKVGIYPTNLANPTDYETTPVAVHVNTADVVRNVEMSFHPNP